MTSLSDHYARRMQDVTDAYTASGPYVSRIAASEIIAKLRVQDPDLLAGWLDEQAEHFLWQMINDRDRSRRGHLAATSGRSAFRDAADAAEQGDETALRPYLDGHVYAVADGSRRRLATLTRPDLEYVAGGYEKRARSNAFRGTFMRTLAKKVAPGRVVEDYFTEAQIAVMMSSLPDDDRDDD